MASVISAGTSTGSALNMTGDTSGALALATNNGTTAVTITTAQKVGVGVASPDATLSVNGNIDAAPGSVSVPAYGFYPLGTYGSTGMFAPAANTVAFSTSGGERMRISSAGNLGIATTNPQTFLHIGSTSGLVPQIMLGQATSYRLDIGYNNSAEYGFLQAYAANTTTYDDIVVNPLGGQLLVGTTAAQPGYGNTNTGVQLSNNGSTFSRAAADYVMVLNQNTVDGSSYYQINFRVNNVAKGTIISTSTTTAYNTSSDYRLKYDIVPMTGALERVAQLQPRFYKWHEDNSSGEGFIAHELAEVCPQAVTGEKDAVDSKGEPVYQGIDVSFLVATLTAAIQELKVIVDAQAVEIAALKTQVGA